MSKLSVVILAAGQGKRFHSDRPKVFHKLCGRPMVLYIVEATRRLESDKMIMVVQRDFEPIINGVEFIVQIEPRGTGDALISAMPALNDSERVLVIPGDVPLIKTRTLKALTKAHKGNSCTVLSMIPEDPESYGRIVRDKGGVLKIVEERDATPEEKEIREVNTGIYIFNKPELFESLGYLTPQNVQGEYYLTDVVGIMSNKGYKIGSFVVKDSSETIGINDRNALSYVNETLKKEIIREHQLKGVTIYEPVDLDYDVRIGKDTIIYPFTALYGKTVVGKNCKVGPNVVIVDSKIPAGMVIKPFTLIKKDVEEENTFRMENI